MPAGRLLKGMRQPEKGRLFKMSAHQLHADRQVLRVKPDRESQPRHARQVGRQGEDILKVHGQRVIAVLADLEGGGGRHRRGDRIHRGEGRIEICPDQGAHFLRLPVIGVVIAGRKRVGAQHDAPLDLGAKAPPARSA